MPFAPPPPLHLLRLRRRRAVVAAAPSLRSRAGATWGLPSSAGGTHAATRRGKGRGGHRQPRRLFSRVSRSNVRGNTTDSKQTNNKKKEKTNFCSPAPPPLPKKKTHQQGAAVGARRVRVVAVIAVLVDVAVLEEPHRPLRHLKVRVLKRRRQALRGDSTSARRPEGAFCACCSRQRNQNEIENGGGGSAVATRRFHGADAPSLCVGDVHVGVTRAARRGERSGTAIYRTAVSECASAMS